MSQNITLLHFLNIIFQIGFISLALFASVRCEADPTAKVPAQPYTPAPPYHPPTLLHGYTPRPQGYGYGAYPPKPHHVPDYGSPPSCAKDLEKLPYPTSYCLQDDVMHFSKPLQTYAFE